MHVLAELFQPSQPATTALHIGEAYFIWRYYTSVSAARTLCEVLRNHTAHPDLLDVITHFVTDLEKPQMETLHELMQKEGVDFPTILPAKPEANPADIPAGAKFTDMEVANLLVVKLEALFALCNMSMVQSLRADVGSMFLTFQGQLLPVALRLKRAMHQHGWLMVPPSHTH